MILITNQTGSYSIDILTDIGQSEQYPNGWTFERFTNELRAIDSTEFTVKMKSYGGDIAEAFPIYDELMTIKKRSVCDIVGDTASAATIISCGCDHVRINPNARFLVHSAQTELKGNAFDFQDAAEYLLQQDQRIIDVYVKKTGKPKDEIYDLMKENKWLTPIEALEWGFVDEISKDKSKIINKVTNIIMTEDEIAALKAENEALKLQVAEALAKLAEYETEKEEMIDAEIDAEIETAVTAGKIEATAKDGFKAFGKSNGKESLKAIFNAIKVVVDLASIPTPKEAPTAKTKDQIFEDFKAGRVNYDEASKQIKEVK